MTTFIVISIIAIALIGIIVVAELLAVTLLLLRVKNLVQEVLDRVDPVVDKTRDLLRTANTVADDVQGKAKHIGSDAVRMSDTVAKRVDSTTWVLQRLITSPALAAMAFAFGVRRGFSTFRAERRARKATAGRAELVLRPTREEVTEVEIYRAA